MSKHAEGSFLMDGFTNLKDATVKFAKNERSNFHKACTEALSSTVDIRDMLNKQAVTKKQANREYAGVLCPNPAKSAMLSGFIQ